MHKHAKKEENTHCENIEVLDEKIELNPQPEVAETISEVEVLKQEKEKLQQENSALVEKVKLAQAELINYRKRKDEEVTSILKYANQDLITEIIAVVDNLERAVNVNEDKLTPELKNYLSGFKMIYASLMDALKKYGVEEINRVGEVFDPNQEQALLTDCVAELEDEVVIEVLLKGYKLKDRVIRPASVKINQK